MCCVEQCSATNTYPQLGLYPLGLVVEDPAVPVLLIASGDIVVKGVGRLLPAANGHQTRKQLPAKKTQDAVDFADVTSAWGDHHPIPAQVIKINC